jgi:hypothetical protein
MLTHFAAAHPSILPTAFVTFGFVVIAAVVSIVQRQGRLNDAGWLSRN